MMMMMMMMMMTMMMLMMIVLPVFPVPRCAAIGFQLENPFGWEAVDLDLEQIGLIVHDQTYR
jgi:predicted membrane chloride channel (bestrophin family)